MTLTIPDVRRAERATYHMCIVYEVTAEDAGVPRTFSGKCTNISRGGLAMVLQRPAADGSILKLLLPVANCKVTVPVFAQIMWLQKDNDAYEAGLRFLA